jgi:hypothetical protein
LPLKLYLRPIDAASAPPVRRFWLRPPNEDRLTWLYATELETKTEITETVCPSVTFVHTDILHWYFHFKGEVNDFFTQPQPSVPFRFPF